MTYKRNHKEIFTRIYESNFWGGANSPKSGSGSTVEAAQPYANEVKKFIETHRITSILDIGHGDWEMWGEYRFENLEYVGIDVYKPISENLRKRIGRKGLEFRTLNAVDEALPYAELCLTKDVLQHLPTKDILIILSKMSSYKYVIICNDLYKFQLRDSFKAFRRFMSLRERFSGIKRYENPFFLKLKRTNADIQIGEHRCINLEKDPFAKSTKKFQLIKTFDFNGKANKRPNVVKRIYFYKKI